MSSNEYHKEGLSNQEIANQVISKYAGKSSTTNKRKSITISKDDEEYIKKRARNNVAVKKSREKAKNRIQETQHRVEQLSKENEELQTKVNLLSKELNVLRALFTNGGFTLPGELPYSNNNGSPADLGPPSMTYSSHNRLSDDESSISKSSLHSFDSEKTIYHPLDDPKNSKIPPLRPMPRNPITLSSHKISHHSPSPSSLAYSTERLFALKDDYLSSKDSKSNGPPMLIQPGSHSASTTYHSQYKGDTRHPSVIRSTTDVTTPSTSTNMLGKFCIIKDPQDNGQIKVLPISS